MSYENVDRAKLKLKGKALDVLSGSIKKKKKNKSAHLSLMNDEDNSSSVMNDQNGEGTSQNVAANDKYASLIDEQYLTPAERKFHEQRMTLQRRHLEKLAARSHRERIQEFNQYLANLSEHYDIPKVGPG